MQLDIEKFNPTVAELNIIADEAKALTDSSPLTAIVDMRKKLVTTRRQIETFGKGLRDDANKFAKAVIAKEKELVDIIEPEEERLKGIEAEIEKRKAMEARRESLPSRRAELDAIGDGLECSDEQLLEMDNAQFTEYKQGRIAEKQAAEQQRIDAERRELARQQEIREAEERARVQAEERAKAEKELAERRVKEAEERAERAERDAKERAEREASDKERKEREEKEKLEKQTKYREWRSAQGWTEETKGDYKEENNGASVVLWKKLAIYNID